MNVIIYKAHLKELLKQTKCVRKLFTPKSKNILLLVIETEIEMCNLLEKRFNKDYSKEKSCFVKLQEFVLLNELKEAIKYIKNELDTLAGNLISNPQNEEYI